MSIQPPAPPSTPPPSAAPPSAPPRPPTKSWHIKRNVAIGVVLILVVLIPTLGYLAILPPIELRIVEMSYEEPIIFGKPVGFHVLSYSLEYHNVGIVDATISGNVMIEIDGSRGFGQHAVMQPILLLRIGETQVWNVGLNPSDYIPIQPATTIREQQSSKPLHK